MKQQVVYIYGGESYLNHDDFLERLRTKPVWELPWEPKKGKWSAALPEELGSDYEVFMPVMPNKQNAKYEEWKIWFERHFEYLRDGAILVGCSLGAMFLYKYLIENTLPFKARAAILMAAPLPDLLPEDDRDSGDFVYPSESVHQINETVESIIIMHSQDDFVVPYKHAVAYQELLPEAEFVSFEDKNHFLVPELPELIEKIREMSGK